MAASARASSAHSGRTRPPPLRDEDEEHPARAEDDVVGAGGAHARAAQQLPADGPQAGDDASTDPLARGPEPGDHGKSTRRSRPRPSTYRSSHIETARTKSAVVLGARSPGRVRTRQERPRRARRRRRARARCRPPGGGGPPSTSICGRLVEREAADARPEGDERQRAGPELVGARQRGRGRAADDVGRRRPAELHRRGVDDPPRRAACPAVVSTASPSPTGRAPIALVLDLGAAGARDRARHAAAVQQPRVGRVGDGIDLEGRDVGVEDLDGGRHAAEATPLRRARPCPGAARGRAGRRR